jgi:hypothetical protein
MDEGGGNVVGCVLLAVILSLVCMTALVASCVGAFAR